MKEGALQRSAIGVLPVLAMLALLMPSTASAQELSSAPGLELTSPVRQQLRLLTKHWSSWTNAYYQADQETAASALEQLNTAARRLGMSRLPDLSSAASAFAVDSARGGNFERARWALEAARKLDDERPGNRFRRSHHQASRW